PALERGNFGPTGRQVVDICVIAEPPQRNELIDHFFTQPVNVHCSSRSEVLDSSPDLPWAFGMLTKMVGLLRRPVKRHVKMARAMFREYERLAISCPKLQNRTVHLRDHVSAFFYLYDVSNADIELAYEVLVMQRCAAY